MDTIEERLTKVESNMEAIRATLAEIATLHKKTDERLDNFIYESNRLRTNSFERLERIEAAVESLVGAVRANSRKGDENRADIAALFQVVQTTAGNIDRLERSQETTNQKVEQLIQVVDQQGVRLDTLINRVITDPDEN